MDSRDRRAALLQQAFAVKKGAARATTSRIPPRPRDQPARIGEFQQGLWLQHRLQPESAAYNLVSAYRLPPGVAVERLERSFAAVVRRTRILRSTFVPDGESAVQIIHDDLPGGFALTRVQAAPGCLKERAEEEARRPFDLEAGPLFRALLVEDGSDRLIVLVLHHLLADERSLLYLWKDAAAAYNGEPEGDSPPIQYDDYLHWQSRESPESRDADLDFWRGRLTPPPGDLLLPFSRSASADRSSRGELLLQAVEPDVSADVRRLAASARSTSFSVYAFAFRLLLQRTAEGGDWAYATPVSRRLHPDTARMVGYFLNPVVVPSSIALQTPVGEAIRAAAADLRLLISHASIPFDELADRFAPTGRSGRAPLVQTMFVHQEEHERPVLGGLRLEPLTLDLGEAKFDLTFFVSEGARSLQLGIEYRTAVFERTWMERLLARYATLLRRLAESPGGRAGEIDVLPPEEAAELRVWSAGEPLRSATDALLPHRIFEQSRKARDQPAVVSDARTWSYADLAREGRRIAAALAHRGVAPGDRVAVYVDRSPEMIAAVLGALWSGAAYVPLDPSYPEGRASTVLRDAAVQAIVTTQTLRQQLPPDGPEAVLVDQTEHGESEIVDAASDRPAYLLYTSGSTGEPKGVVVDHRNLQASTAAREQYYGDPPRRFLLLPSLAFDSSVAGLFWTLAAGGALVVPSEEQSRDPRLLAELIDRHQVDALLCVPSLYRVILAESRRVGGPSLRSLRTVIVAGEACPPSLTAEHFSALPDARLFNEYGPTEATVWATVDELHADDVDEAVSIGRPVPGVSVEVLDEGGRPAPPGVPGEGWISGPTVAQGYWGKPDLSAERFTEGPGPDGSKRAYRTGDRLVWTADGRLLFQGRIDNQVKLRGFRIEPEEIEAALEARTDVAEAVVVLRDMGASEALVAFVRASGPVGDLREHLAKRLPEYMVPSRIVELPDFPRLPNGKADRRRLAEVEPAPPATDRRRTPALSERRHALVSLWEGLLGVAGVGANDNFFQLGGHSLLIVRMAAVLERDFGVRISPAELFQHPTIEEIDRLIEARRDAAAPTYRHLFPLQPGGDGPPLIFCIPHFFADLYSRRFRGVRPVYGLRGVGIRPNGNRGLWPSMEALGRDLAEETLRRFPDEREFSVAGYSFGASMAFELVRTFEARGVAVRDLQLIAPMPLDFLRLGPLRVQLDALRKPLGEVSTSEAIFRLLRDNAPWKTRPYRRLRRMLLTQNRRRLLCLAGDQRKRRGRELTPEMLHADVRLERFRLHSRYEPGVVQAPTVVFNAREPDTDAAATWRPHFAGPLEVVEIADPHLGGDAVEAARAGILQYLEENDRS